MLEETALKELLLSAAAGFFGLSLAVVSFHSFARSFVKGGAKGMRRNNQSVFF